jgi:hypothetical protein
MEGFMSRLRWTGFLLWLLLGSVSLWGDDSSRLAIDGTYWAKLTVNQKVPFMIGYVDGRDEGFEQGKLQALNLLIDVSGVKGEPSKRVLALTDYSSGTPYLFGQLVDGVDTCYKDFRNQSLTVNDCYTWTVYGIRGESDKQREEFLEILRKAHANAK